MTWSFLAPVLSATLSIVRCCTISGGVADHPPALVAAERARLHEGDGLPDLVRVLLVMHLELPALHVALAVLRVHDRAVDANHDGLIHLVRDDRPDERADGFCVGGFHGVMRGPFRRAPRSRGRDASWPRGPFSRPSVGCWKA